MLIVLGGLLGSGAKTLANELAKRHGFHRYDIDRKKLRKPSLDPRGNFKVLQPESDAQRLKIYETIFEEFPLLSKMYTDVVVDDVFHRDIPREYFLSEARKHYHPVVFVWIESDEDSVKVRLERMEEAGMVESLEAALRRRARASARMQPLPASTPTFFHKTFDREGAAAQQIIDQKISALWKLIQEHVHS